MKPDAAPHLMKSTYPFTEGTSSDMRLVGDKNPASSILFGVASIQLLVGLVGWFDYRVNPDVDIPQLKWFLYNFQSGSFTWADWALTFSGAIYLLLGFYARWASVAAALSAALLYAAALGMQALQGNGPPQSGAITKILVTVLLVAAVVVALRCPAAPGQSAE